MKSIRISRSEFFLYVKIVLSLSILPFLLSIFNTFYPLLQHGVIRSFSTFYTIQGFILLLEAIGIPIATAILIHRSEKRKGCKDHFWLVIGIIFGFYGFISYLVWNILKEFNLIIPENHQYLKISEIGLRPQDRDNFMRI
jgi:hypothetical protein